MLNPFKWRRIETVYIEYRGKRYPIFSTYGRMSPSRVAVKVGGIVALVASALGMILAFRG